MGIITHHKVVASLPAELEPNSIYYVRAGEGFDQYVTNSGGLVVAYPMNKPPGSHPPLGEVVLFPRSAPAPLMVDSNDHVWLRSGYLVTPDEYDTYPDAFDLLTPNLLSYVYRGTSGVTGSTAVALEVGGAIYLFGSTSVRSLDGGDTWEAVSLAGGDKAGAAYGNGVGVVTLANTANYYTTTDGVNWTARTFASGNSSGQIVYGNGVFVENATAVGSLRVSANGIDWTTVSLPAGYRGGLLGFAGGQFINVETASPPGRIAVSEDGVTWVAAPAAPSALYNTVEYIDGVVYLLASNTLARSIDGVNWERVDAPQRTWRAMAYGNGVFVLKATTAHYAVSTDNMASWEEIEIQSPMYPSNTHALVRYQGDRFRFFGAAIYDVMFELLGLPEAHAVGSAVQYVRIK